MAMERAMKDGGIEREQVGKKEGGMGDKDGSSDRICECSCDFHSEWR